MRESRSIMGMPVHLEIVDAHAAQADFDAVFDYFTTIDARFSTYKEDSEISKINRREIRPEQYSIEMREVFSLAEEMSKKTNGYFEIHTPMNSIDPSGLVKGWAIQKAADMLRAKGFKNFYVEIGGDIQTNGLNAEGKEWSIGIRNPLNISDKEEVVKVIYPHGKGIATSGTYLRGAHIYNPFITEKPSSYVSLSVIGPNVYEADCVATAAFAMGEEGMNFLAELPDFEAYAIDPRGIAIYTKGFEEYTYI